MIAQLFLGNTGTLGIVGWPAGDTFTGEMGIFWKETVRFLDISNGIEL